MKTIKQFIFISAAAMLLISISCIDELRVKGNGIPATQGRIISDFTKVKSDGSFEVHITKGEQFEVIVSADENIIQYIDTHVDGDVLHLETNGTMSINNQLPMEIFVTAPALEGLKLSGSGIITTDYFSSNTMDIILSGSGKIKTAFECEQTDVKISGSGDIELSGMALKANLKISGSGDIEASNLSTIDCYTSTSGSGDIWISADRFLEANISGSGNVYYYGQASVEADISGSGKVINEN